MKSRLLTLLLTLWIGQYAYSQDQKVIAKFVVSDARINKNDLTKLYLDNGAYFAFYQVTGDSNTYFSSMMTKSDSQSYGRIYSLGNEIFPATERDYQKENIAFKWAFQNTYDKEKGTADVKMTLTTKPVGVAFELTILTEKLDLLVYKGYMQGSLKDIN